MFGFLASFFLAVAGIALLFGAYRYLFQLLGLDNQGTGQPENPDGNQTGQDRKPDHTRKWVYIIALLVSVVAFAVNYYIWDWDNTGLLPLLADSNEITIQPDPLSEKPVPIIRIQDEITHYFYAREALDDDESMTATVSRFLTLVTDHWGRPGNVLMYMLPSQESLLLRRWVSAILLILVVAETIMIMLTLLDVKGFAKDSSTESTASTENSNRQPDTQNGNASKTPDAEDRQTDDAKPNSNPEATDDAENSNGQSQTHDGDATDASTVNPIWRWIKQRAWDLFFVVLSALSVSLVVVFIWTQPWFIYFGVQSLTQIPFMFFLVAAISAMLQEKKWRAAFFFSLLPITRHEALPLLILWVAFLYRVQIYRFLEQLISEVRESNTSNASNTNTNQNKDDEQTPENQPEISPLGLSVLTFLPYGLWNLMSFAVRNDAPLPELFRNNSNPIYPAQSLDFLFTTAGDWISGHVLVPFAASALVLVVIFGVNAWKFLNKSAAEAQQADKLYLSWSNMARSTWGIFFIAYFLIHVFILAIPGNRYASGGYVFFVLPIAPAIAIIATLPLRGLLFWMKMKERRTVIPFYIIALVVLALLQINNTNNMFPILDFIAEVPELHVADIIPEDFEADYVQFIDHAQAIEQSIGPIENFRNQGEGDPLLLINNPIARFHLAQENKDYERVFCPTDLSNIETDLPFYPNLFYEDAILVMDGVPGNGITSSYMVDEYESFVLNHVEIANYLLKINQSSWPELLNPFATYIWAHPIHSMNSFNSRQPYFPETTKSYELQFNLTRWYLTVDITYDLRFDINPEQLGSNYAPEDNTGIAIWTLGQFRPDNTRHSYSKSSIGYLFRDSLQPSDENWRQLYIDRYCGFTENRHDLLVNHEPECVLPDLIHFLRFDADGTCPDSFPHLPRNTRLPALACTLDDQVGGETYCLVVYGDSRFAVNTGSGAWFHGMPHGAVAPCKFDEEGSWSGRAFADLTYDDLDVNLLTFGCMGWIKLGENVALRDGELTDLQDVELWD